MRFSSAARVPTFLALAAVFLTADAQSRRRISVRTYRTNYRIDTWDDGRDELYRVTFWKFGLQSIYTFNAGGRLRTITARDTLYTFDPTSASRMLMSSGDDALEDVETDLTPAIDCTTCETTWNTLCDAGLTDVCFLDDNNPADFDQDANDSVRRFCGAVGSACERTASDVCGNQCDQGTGPAPTSEPTPVTPEPTPATPEPTTSVPTTSAPTSAPTSATTAAPSSAPTSAPTSATTSTPSSAPTSVPTPATTAAPTTAPTSAQTSAMTSTPTLAPTSAPTSATSTPSSAPTSVPTPAPTSAPTTAPTSAQTSAMTSTPTSAPTSAATSATTSTPSTAPTSIPTSAPTSAATLTTTAAPSSTPTSASTSATTSTPSSAPTSANTSATTSTPSSAPTSVPTSTPTSAATSATTLTPTTEPTSPPTSTPSSAPTSAPTSVTTSTPTAARTSDPTSAPTSSPTSPPTSASTPSATSTPTSAVTSAPTSAPASSPTSAPTSATTAGPTVEAIDACSSNPCENGGLCAIDPAGGHICLCTSGYGGMSCQIDTSSLDPFFIEVDFNGTWTDERRAIVQSAADRWAEVITHVPCGGTVELPGGRLLVTATVGEIDGVGGTLGAAAPTNIWNECRSISLKGEMLFDSADIEDLEANGELEGVVLHQMGHTIGVGTLWGDTFGECSSCYTDEDPAWTCPAAVSAYADLGGSGADIVEVDGEAGTICSHLDEGIFGDELSTATLTNPMFLSKMTAATLEDINYIVDPSAVDAYILPSERGGLVEGESEPSMVTRNTAVETVVLAVDSDGNVVEELVGTKMEFGGI